MELEKEIHLDKFKAPFPSSEVEWRLKTAGKNGKGSWAMLLPYVTNRAIMNRLDEVAGPVLSRPGENHFEYPRQTLASIHQALRRDGRAVKEIADLSCLPMPAMQ